MPESWIAEGRIGMNFILQSLNGFPRNSVDIDSALDVLIDLQGHILRMTQYRRLSCDVELKNEGVHVCSWIRAIRSDEGEGVFKVKLNGGINGEATPERNDYLGAVGCAVDAALKGSHPHRNRLEGDRYVIGVFDGKIVLNQEKDVRIGRIRLNVDFQGLNALLFGRNLDGPREKEEEGGQGEEHADSDGDSHVKPRPARFQSLVVVRDQRH